METAKHPLPVSQKEWEELGIGQPDVIIVSGDAYIDHPSFGTALIGRLLERAGFSVAVIPQPDWHSTKDFERFGRPR
ncbi:MAG: YgiQ family radical SAM protein, partial [Clostridia bacterium]|nr:YgiQ family radical SAM protein [Clostridia bacterium]